MKTISLLLTFLLSIHLLACQTTHDRHISSSQLQPGGRSGLHGMVVFGHGSYFIEHIPMLHPPHDFQIVASILIKDKNGKVLTPDLSKQGFTLKPNNQFSLNDFVDNNLKKFGAEIYEGSFEQNGKIIAGLEGVTIEVQQILLARQLPSESTQQVFTVTDTAKNTYQTDIITSKNNAQVIKNLNLNKTLWCVTAPDFFEFCQ